MSIFDRDFDFEEMEIYWDLDEEIFPQEFGAEEGIDIDDPDYEPDDVMGWIGVALELSHLDNDILRPVGAVIRDGNYDPTEDQDWIYGGRY